MRLRRRVRLRPPNGEFLLLHQPELDVLLTLAPWMLKLFAVLVTLSDRYTGAGTATFARLVTLCAPLQPRSGPRLYAPDAQAIRKAVLEFETSRILWRNVVRSQQGECLFFEVLPRVVNPRTKARLEGGIGSPPHRPHR